MNLINSPAVLLGFVIYVGFILLKSAFILHFKYDDGSELPFFIIGSMAFLAPIVYSDTFQSNLFIFFILYFVFKEIKAIAFGKWEII